MKRLVGLVGAVAMTFTVFGASPAAAAQTQVNCTANSGALQPAIDAASPGSTLVLSGICVGEFKVSKDLTLKGTPGATLYQPEDRDCPTCVTLSVTNGNVHFKNLTIASYCIRSCHSYGQMGITNGGNLSLMNVVVTHHDCGGIQNYGGTLTLVRSQVVANGTSESDQGCGGINGGPIDVETSTIGDGVFGWGTIDRSAITGMSVKAQTGSNGGVFEGVITNSTIASHNFYGGDVSILNSTIVGSFSADGARVAGSIIPLCEGTIISGGYNIVMDASPYIDDCCSHECNFVSLSTDLVGYSDGTGAIDVKLGGYGQHGGPTPVFQLLAKSPALDVIPIGALATDGTPLCPSVGSIDQRGFPRPEGSACDVGAVERKV